MNSSSPCSRYHPGRAVGGERDAVLEGAGRMVSQRPVGRRSGEAPQRLHRHAHKERFRWSGKEEPVGGLQRTSSSPGSSTGHVGGSLKIFANKGR